MGNCAWSMPPVMVGVWRICSTPETTMRMLLELAIADDATNAQQLVCAEQRERIAPELRSMRQRITALVNLETRTTNPPFYEEVALLIFETTGVEQRNLRIQVAQVQYALSDRTDTSAILTVSGNMRIQSIGLLQNIAATEIVPAKSQFVLEQGVWRYCPQPEPEPASTDA